MFVQIRGTGILSICAYFCPKRRAIFLSCSVKNETTHPSTPADGYSSPEGMEDLVANESFKNDR